MERQIEYFRCKYPNYEIIKDIEYDEDKNEGLLPSWWGKKDVSSRLPRGVSDKFTSNLNSAISNFKNTRLQCP